MGPTSLESRGPDEPMLKVDPGVAEQPRVTLQPADDLRHIAIVQRAPGSLYDERRPQAERCDLRDARLRERRDESDAVHAGVNVSAEHGIERDRAFEQLRRDGLLIEVARAH